MIGNIITAKQYDGNGVSSLPSKVALVLPMLHTKEWDRRLANCHITGNNISNSQYLLWFFNSDRKFDKFRYSCRRGVHKKLCKTDMDMNNIVAILKSNDEDAIAFLEETLKAELKQKMDKENNLKQKLKKIIK